MFKNFSPWLLGINGRQSELIELALTYGFRGMDVDMADMLRRSQRTSLEDATKYLRAAEIKIGGFDLGINLDADDEAFTTQVATLHPMADIAKELGTQRAYVKLPAATDRLPYHEYFEIQRARLNQVAEVLVPREIKLGVTFAAGKELEEGKQFPFVRDVEGFKALVTSIPAANVGFIIDTFDWVVGSGSMDQLTEIPADKIVGLRLGSVASDAEASTAKTLDRVLPAKEGLLNHVEVIKHLQSISYNGPMSPTASSSRYKGQTRESTVQQAQEAIDSISKDAGIPVAPLPMDLIEDIPYEPTPAT
ncbi:TIM barrel protein [Novipirellula artificiosorum]|uniref:Xylose isomerase-like TIM barrel n=1 Tax=Novipirellula artificiosorum TaxID=2528016 RepID=A0A5C6DCF0_9BACT|nr:TIM barrel protein [Novipirellula artificiosorum]TWU33391.1 Xylose isomerase-like TIM barrel [Novipirellula artificiosorum]